jgi:hypothetical protein
MRPPVVALAFALALSLGGEARAEWQIKGFIGPIFNASTTLLDPDEATQKAHRTLGVSFTELGEIFGVEAEVARTPGFFEREPTGRNVVLSSSVISLTGSLIVAVPRHVAEYGLRPYAVVGGGLLRARYDDKQGLIPVSDTMSATTFGAGVTGFLSRRIGVSWDLRRLQTAGGYSLARTFLTDESERLSFWRATIAVAIR